MNTASKQQLSALMDGELAADETRFLLRRMRHEPELASAWSRYHVLRDCLQDQLLVHAAADRFVACVMQATVAPRHAQSARGHGRRWLHIGMGGTLAAGVAVAALIMVRPGADIAPGATTTPALATVTAMAQPAVTAPAAPPTVQDFSLLLHQSRTPLLNVEPASAVRSRSFYAKPLTFNRRSPPQWIVHQQQLANGAAVRFPSIYAAPPAQAAPQAPTATGAH